MDPFLSAVLMDSINSLFLTLESNDIVITLKIIHAICSQLLCHYIIFAWQCQIHWHCQGANQYRDSCPVGLYILETCDPLMG
jgi:hypothetical protein